MHSPHRESRAVTKGPKKVLILFCNQQFNLQTLLIGLQLCKPATMAVALALLCSVASLLLCATLAAGDKTYVLDYSDLGGAPYTVDFDRRSVRLGGVSTAQHNAHSLAVAAEWFCLHNIDFGTCSTSAVCLRPCHCCVPRRASYIPPHGVNMQHERSVPPTVPLLCSSPC
jgi:hypothetical protein